MRRAAAMDEIKASLAAREAVTRPVLDYLKNKWRLCCCRLIKFRTSIVLDDHELQGLAGSKVMDDAFARVENRLTYGLINDVFVLARAYAAAI